MIAGLSHTGADQRTRSATNRWIPLKLLLPAAAVVVVLFGGGLLLGVLQSLGHLPSAGFEELTGRHFTNVLSDADFFTSLMLTAYISLTSTLLAAGISLLMALFFISFEKPMKIVDFVFQLPLTVPHLVIAAALIFMLSPSGLISRCLHAVGLISRPVQFPLIINDPLSIGIILAYVWKEVPFITLMILSVLKSSGRELIEVGRTLKAGRWQRFRYITLPLIYPSLGAAGLIVFAFTFGAFEVPYLMGRTYPLTLPVWAYKSYSDVDLMARPEGIATGVIIALIVIIAVALSQVLTQIARRRGVIL